MRVSKARRLRSLIEALADYLEDNEAVEAVELFPKWDGTARYTTDQRVQYQGVLYRCLTEHTAQPDWNPADAPSLWARVLIEDPNIIPEWIQPDSTNPYAKGDKVTHNGKTWVSTCDGNVWEPGVYGWDEVTE